MTYCRKIQDYEVLCDSQAKQLLIQTEEIGNSKHRISQKDEDYEEKVMQVERDAERRIFEAEKVLRNQVI